MIDPSSFGIDETNFETTINHGILEYHLGMQDYFIIAGGVVDYYYLVETTRLFFLARFIGME